ncbi:cysteine desulfurase NifS [Clostridium rectalis]|uniref:cysteine desulfurase NifS n=1 Tax=Clostridium rectalis TaxID=2040295 RepID=UPI000F638E83|nr:cysteine desulfurase NifS [Clostridium rectalis]
MKDKIYMDYAATTYLKEKVIENMMPFITTNFGNPSSQYSVSTESKMAIDINRFKIAKAIKANREEVFFTSGATEADNWAIKGFALKNKNKGNHIITSQIEHEAVLKSCKYLETLGFQITYLSVNKKGFIDINELRKAIKKETILVSIIFANNEIGTIQPIKEIGDICYENNIVFHTDAVQALGKISIDVLAMHIDMISLSAHKIYGPKGIGGLYIRKGIKIQNLIHGGSQERGRRAGTENIPFIVGFGTAVELAIQNMKCENKRLTSLRDMFIEKLLNIPNAYLNGDYKNRLPNNINVTFDGIQGEDLVFILDREGICVSSGSACQSTSINPSHVLLALGLNKNLAKSSLRFSIGDKTTKEEINYVVNIISQIIEKLRKNNI